MRSLSTFIAVVTAACIAGPHAKADQTYYGSPSLLPNPTYAPQQFSGRSAYLAQTPNELPPQAPLPPAAPTVDPVEPEAVGSGVNNYDASGVNAGDVGYSLYGHGHGYSGHGWFASVSGLIMDFDADDHTRFSYDNTLGAQYSILDSKDASMDYSGGFEVRLGKYFCCGRHALELVYWGIYPSDNEVTTTGGAADNARSYLDYSWVSNAPATQTGDYYTVGSSAHRLRRDWQFHNAEVNLMSFCYCCCGGCGSCCDGGCVGCTDCCGGCVGGHCKPHGFRATLGVGFRYFRFADSLQFSAATAGLGTPYIYDDNRQLNHAVDLSNDLFGFQLNGAIDYQLGCRWKLRAASKFGVYGNHVRQRQWISNTDGYFTYGGNNYNFDSDKDDVAFIGELDLGLNYCINCHWNVSVGYRAVVAAGVALAPSQVTQDVRDIANVRYIDTNDSLILHGGYAGIEFNY